MPPESLSSYLGTKVSPVQSREHIEKLLLKVDAQGFRWSRGVGFPGHESLEAGISWKGREIAFRLEVSYENEKEQWQRLRALYWFLKAKIEAIQFGLVDLEQEFMPYLLVKGGQTVYESIGGERLPLLGPGQEVER